MAFELPTLPYAKNALEPYLSQETIEYHYGKHHQAYVNKLNTLISGSKFENTSLEEIIMNADGSLFNNAAQVWNHTFYWNSMRPKENQQPSQYLMDKISKAFGSLELFKKQFTEAAMGQFGSGWAWLVKNKDGKLNIVKTSNANNPMTDGYKPLLTCDVWEHAYYIDTRNDRNQYVNNFWNVTNWEFVEQNYF